MLVYVDSSAFIKLAISEPESDSLRLYLDVDAILVASRLAEIETTRAIRRHQFDTEPALDQLFARVTFREIDRSVGQAAGMLNPTGLRTVDAIHLASALELRRELDAFITYDARLAEAARAHRLPVVAPA